MQQLNILMCMMEKHENIIEYTDRVFVFTYKYFLSKENGQNRICNSRFSRIKSHKFGKSYIKRNL